MSARLSTSSKYRSLVINLTLWTHNGTRCVQLYAYMGLPKHHSFSDFNDTNKVKFSRTSAATIFHRRFPLIDKASVPFQDLFEEEIVQTTPSRFILFLVICSVCMEPCETMQKNTSHYFHAVDWDTCESFILYS